MLVVRKLEDEVVRSSARLSRAWFLAKNHRKANAQPTLQERSEVQMFSCREVAACMLGLGLALQLLLPGYYSQGSIPIPHDLAPRESGTFLVTCRRKSSSDSLATSVALYTSTSAKSFCD
jgi:hypothetical protein